MEYRKKRVLEVYGETDVKIEKRIEKKDKGRKSYYRYYTDRKFGDAKNYALCLNSGILGIDKCIDFIIDVAENFNKQSNISFQHVSINKIDKQNNMQYNVLHGEVRRYEFFNQIN